ncbi:amino acid transporter/nucleotide-binding universal stress UspA family protein [Halarchaeum rubridurum]|uniref:Amino acid transporter n=1 Tax=Halarchaeum rubridurum TaxID=489911 RepID=A0A830FYZ5_9EURY|nr:amino acid permease [Halarchaeum rubridurum]MBP1953446.1 amino acid transporter/nucleotide-binding universal stress UspA family protein [Halarchaeum rubridurum]GGM65224.1 amino acid transporter [Halarchaeum rubridurum]
MSDDASGGNVEAELSRDMGLFGITFIGIGAMIGAGVFALTGFAAGLAGPALLLAFLLNGVIASLTAMSYAELGSSFPRSGGAYNWVTEALPRPWGFFTGWTNWFAQAVACALYAVTFGSFFTEFLVVLGILHHDFVLFGVVTKPILDKLLAAVVVAFFAYINYRGAEETGKIGIVVTTIKVIILGVFVVFGAMATFEDPTWPTKFFAGQGFFANGITGVLAAMGFTYVAFEGYDIIVQSGEEVIDPGVNIPKAIFYSIVVVIPIYILVAFAAIGGITITQDLLNFAGVSGAPADWATWNLLGELGELGIIQAAGQFVPYGLPLLLIAGLTATMSALNATLYASSRIAFSMSRDKLFPDKMSEIHSETRAPYLAIIVSAGIIALMALTLPIESVAASSSVMFLLLFSMVNVAVIAMRKNRPDLERPFEVPFMPAVPILGIVFQLLLAPFLLTSLGLSPGVGPQSEGFVALVTMVIWFAIGIAVYYGYSEARERERMEEEAPTVVHERTPTGRENQILVPIANPEHAEQFMRTAVDVAKDRDAEILVMSVVTVPQQTPLDQGRQFVDEKRAVLEEAMTVAEDADVPVNGTVRIGHDVAQAILNTITQEESDAVLMGWRGRSRRRDFVLGSNLDTVVTDADCDVLVEKVGESADGDVDSIFLPTAGGPHAELAAEVARAVARTEAATVEVAHVIDPGAGEDARADAEGRIDDTMAVLDDVDAERTLLEGADVADTIVEHAGDHDLTVIGATRESLLQQLTFGAIPEEVGRRISTPVVMTKRNLGIGSRLQRWFSRT